MWKCVVVSRKYRINIAIYCRKRQYTAPFGAICPLARTKYVNIPTLQGDLADDDATNYVVRAKSVQTASSRLIFEKPSPTDFLQITTTQVKTCL